MSSKTFLQRLFGNLNCHYQGTKDYYEVQWHFRKVMLYKLCSVNNKYCPMVVSAANYTSSELQNIET